MTRESEMPGGAEAPRDAAEDTVELELTAAEQLELARAGEAALLSPRSIPDGPGYDTFIYTRTRRADVLGTITFAAIVCAITTALGWRALISGPTPAAVAVTSSLTQAAPAPSDPQPLRAVVQIPNPFDATEVFELPAETNEAEARTAVAELLLQRAQERREQGLHLRRASTHQAHRPPPIRPSDVFVTKVLGSASRFADAPGASSGIAE
jgi:hypothetical protein